MQQEDVVNRCELKSCVERLCLRNKSLSLYVIKENIGLCQEN